MTNLSIDNFSFDLGLSNGTEDLKLRLFAEGSHPFYKFIRFVGYLRDHDFLESKIDCTVEVENYFNGEKNYTVRIEVEEDTITFIVGDKSIDYDLHLFLGELDENGFTIGGFWYDRTITETGFVICHDDLSYFIVTDKEGQCIFTRDENDGNKLTLIDLFTVLEDEREAEAYSHKAEQVVIDYIASL